MSRTVDEGASAFMRGSMRRAWPLALAVFAACTNEPISAPVVNPSSNGTKWKCTAETAGFGDWSALGIDYVRLPTGCQLDPVGKRGSCNVGGCTVPDVFTVATTPAQLAPFVTCTSSTGIDFAHQRVLFVRQGLRVGETMGVEPVGWIVQKNGAITVGENRQSFCTGGELITGGIVSYAITLPIPTSTTSSVARHICFRRVSCDCTEEECS